MIFFLKHKQFLSGQPVTKSLTIDAAYRCQLNKMGIKIKGFQTMPQNRRLCFDYPPTAKQNIHVFLKKNFDFPKTNQKMQRKGGNSFFLYFLKKRDCTTKRYV